MINMPKNHDINRFIGYFSNERSLFISRRMKLNNLQFSHCDKWDILHTFPC